MVAAVPIKCSGSGLGTAAPTEAGQLKIGLTAMQPVENAPGHCTYSVLTVIAAVPYARLLRSRSYCSL